MAKPSPEVSKRAEDEAEVIKLIFGEDVVYCKTRDCWKQFHNLELRVRLGSTTTDKSGVSVELDVNCPPLYPIDTPKIAILKPIGVEKNEVSELTKILNTRIHQIGGSELIYDLCIETQNYLRTKRNSVENNEKSKSAAPLLHPASIQTTGRQNSVDSRLSVCLADDEEPVEVRAEDELKCRREKWLKRLGPLGEGVKVELISKPGQLIEVVRILDATVQRKPLHPVATEWFGFDQQRPILVSEYRFEYKMPGRDKNLVAKLSSFEKSLKAFASHVLNNNLLPVDEEFLTTFAFVHVHRASSISTSFDVRLSVGQYMDLDSRPLSDEGVLQNLLKTSKETLLPQIANHLICGLKSLHEHRVSHGGLELNNVWLRSDNIFFISDHHLCSDILHFCDAFANITEEGVRRRRVSIHSLRLRDLRSLGTILTEINQKDKNSFANQEYLTDFVSQCSLSDAHVQNLSNHRFLYLSFPTIPTTEDGSTSFTHNPGVSLKHSGRLLKEYHVVNFLGRGGFGEVWCARNKLDGNCYAVKRIPLTNVPWKQIDRIKNEVALFSKITDDHVVRYFSSWVETITLDANEVDVTTESTSQNTSDDQSLLPSKLRNLDDQAAGDFRTANRSTSDSSSSSDSGPGFFHAPKAQRHQPTTILSMSHAGSDLSVVFAGDDRNEGHVLALSDLSEEDTTSEKQPKTSEVSLTYLCLQMEYCQNQTLRVLIDRHELFENPAMIWRIFKETLFGLQCLHRHMIHRDIKPANIFLDGNWSVKLGDFGLATRALFNQEDDGAGVDANSSNAIHTSMTKNIGTMLYIAPEARQNENKIYDSKFDVYSLGVVLFEMILRPPETRIERIQILEQLRDELVFPKDTFDYLPPTHRKPAEKLLKWCLKRDPIERPTATELIESGFIPHITSDEDKFRKLCTQVANNVKHRLRPLLLNELFNAKLQPAIGNYFDRKYCLESMNRPYPLDTIKMLSDLFRLNGYDFLHNEELLPCAQNFLFEGSDSTLLSSLCEPYKLMDDRNGAILTLPTTFRSGLARYWAYRETGRLRSYSIGRVFSQSSSSSNHPEARFECEVDLLAPRGQHAQISVDLLNLIVEIFRKLYTNESRCKLVINHRALLKAIALHYGLSEEYQLNNLLNLLYEFSSQSRKDAYSNLLFGLTHQCGMSEKAAHEMLIFLNLPVSTTHQLRERVKPLLRSKNDEVRSNAECALAEMDFVFHKICHKLAPQLGLTFLPTFCYQPLIFADGLLFSLRVEFSNSRGKTSWCPILSGGRYDRFLGMNRQVGTSTLETTCAFGFNLSIENAANLPFIIKKDKKRVATCTALVSCSSLDYFSSAAAMATQLRDLGIPTDLWHEELNVNLGGSLLEYCLEKPVQFILQFVSLDDVVIYQNAKFEDSNAANEFRIVQNRVSVGEAVRFFVPQPRDANIEGLHSKLTESSTVDRTDPKNLPTSASMGNVNLKTCSSRASKLSHHVRKKYESHAFAVLGPLLTRFSSKCKIEALITDLPLEVLTAISNIDRTKGHDYAFTEFQLISKQFPRHKTDVMLLFDEMEVFIEQQANSNTMVILLSPGVNESFYRLLL